MYHLKLILDFPLYNIYKKKIKDKLKRIIFLKNL